MEKKQINWTRVRRYVAHLVKIGDTREYFSRAYDIVSMLAVVINIASVVLFTFDRMEEGYGTLLLSIEALTVAFFALDYGLRVWCAYFTFPGLTEPQAILKYILSFSGIIDLLSFLPYYLPFFFPAGATVFKIFRVIRILRLFQINAYYDSLRIISDVIASKKQQLISSVFIILTLMLGSSLCMYSLEHEAQPEVFSNAFSGLWWAASTVLTIGYGDIYPVTTMGKVFGLFISFLGVGMVAIPTGIISAGFVDQYSRIKRVSEYASEEDVHFIKIQLHGRDIWVGKEIHELHLPRGMIIAMIRRGKDNIVPRGDVVLQIDDILILAAEALKDDKHIDLKELVLLEQSPWNGALIRELDISRQTFIVMVKRSGTMLVPRGDLRLMAGDHVILYSQERISHSHLIEV
ncbi:MAG: potassium channel protein [Ruminococcaceae bacterium]|nr:potassium channel protein [Oscillospiraceae bacterium]